MVGSRALVVAEYRRQCPTLTTTVRVFKVSKTTCARRREPRVQTYVGDLLEETVVTVLACHRTWDGTVSCLRLNIIARLHGTAQIIGSRTQAHLRALAVAADFFACRGRPGVVRPGRGKTASERPALLLTVAAGLFAVRTGGC